MAIKKITGILVPRKEREIINWNFEHLFANKVPYTGATGDLDLGTHKIITQEIESPDDLLLDCGTDKTVVLEASVWDDLRFPSTTLNPVGLTGAADLETTDPYMGTLLFSPSTPEICAGQAQLPHCRKLLTPLGFHVHWTPTSTDTGNVLWRLSYMAADKQGTFSGTLTELDVIQASSGVIGRHQTAYFQNIVGIGASISTMIVWKITRVASDVLDTYTGDARLLEVDIHYQIDTLGSRTESSK